MRYHGGKWTLLQPVLTDQPGCGLITSSTGTKGFVKSLEMALPVRPGVLHEKQPRAISQGIGGTTFLEKTCHILQVKNSLNTSSTQHAICESRPAITLRGVEAGADCQWSKIPSYRPVESIGQ